MKREEAIHIVKTTKDWSELREALAVLVPELAESEDEKIIEEIRFAVMQMPSEKQDTKDRCLAWLEKQKEQKPTSFNEPYNSDEYEAVTEGNATSLKRKEQKPADYCSVRDEFDLDGNLKQKPAWSEEDEKMIDNICFHLYAKPDERDEMQKFLKSLRPPFKPSEEQMEAFHSTVRSKAVKRSAHFQAALESLENDLLKLK